MMRVPRFMRRFRRMLTFQDLIMGRKVVMTTTIGGERHHHIEIVPKPITNESQEKFMLSKDTERRIPNVIPSARRPRRVGTDPDPVVS